MTGDFIVHFFLCSQCRLAVGNVHKVFARLSIDVMLDLSSVLYFQCKNLDGSSQLDSYFVAQLTDL